VRVLMTLHLPAVAKVLSDAVAVNLLNMTKIKDTSLSITGYTTSLKNPGARALLLSLPTAVAA
jgi:hypothetical protein